MLQSVKQRRRAFDVDPIGDVEFELSAGTIIGVMILIPAEIQQLPNHLQTPAGAGYVHQGAAVVVAEVGGHAFGEHEAE